MPDGTARSGLLSLNDLEKRGVLSGGGLWVPALMAVGFSAALVLAVVTPGNTRAALLVVAVSLPLLLALYVVPSLWPWWRRISETVAITGIGGLMLATGGAPSPARHLLIFPIVHGVSAQPTGLRAIAVTAYAIAWPIGVSIASGDRSLWVHTFVEVTVWLTLAIGVWLVRLSLSRSTRQLSAAESLRRTLVQGHTDAVYILDPQGRFLEANEATVRLSGVPREQLLGGATFVDVLAPDQVASTVERFQRALDGEAQTYETAITTASGERLDLMVTNIHVSDGESTLGVYGIASDISERVRDRARLETSERRFRTLAESLNDGVYIVRTVGVRETEFMNQAVSEMTGLPLAQLTSLSTIVDHIHPDDVARFREHASRGRAHPEPFRMRWMRPDGEMRWLELHEAPYLDEDGNEIGLLGTVRDITATMELQRSTEAALAREQQAVEHLQQVDVMKNSFLQSVSHELRTPLTSVIGFSQTIRDHGPQLGEERVRFLLDRTIVNAAKLDGMLSDLLDVDRMARGVLTLNLNEIALHELTSKVLAEVSHHVERKIVADLHPATAWLDAPKVERIIENLVTNAQRHAPDGTTIWVRTGPCEPRGAELVVEDDGPGIPEELRDRITEPFVQGPDSARAANPGTGIGLALVARFAELHGGRVSIGDRDGGGASIRVRFCANPDDIPALTSEADAPR